MYKYSKKAEKKFFRAPILAFIFMWYVANPNAKEFGQLRY